jgi:hypothetical protein
MKTLPAALVLVCTLISLSITAAFAQSFAYNAVIYIGWVSDFPVPGIGIQPTYDDAKAEAEQNCGDQSAVNCTEADRFENLTVPIQTFLNVEDNWGGVYTIGPIWLVPPSFQQNEMPLQQEKPYGQPYGQPGASNSNMGFISAAGLSAFTKGKSFTILGGGATQQEAQQNALDACKQAAPNHQPCFALDPGPLQPGQCIFVGTTEKDGFYQPSVNTTGEQGQMVCP